MFKDVSMEMGIYILGRGGESACFSGNEFDLLPKGCNKNFPCPCAFSEFLAEGISVALCLPVRVWAARMLMINCQAQGSVCRDCKVFPGQAGWQGQLFRFHSLCCLSGKISTKSSCCIGTAALCCLEGTAITKDGVDWEQGWEEPMLP